MACAFLFGVGLFSLFYPRFAGIQTQGIVVSFQACNIPNAAVIRSLLALDSGDGKEALIEFTDLSGQRHQMTPGSCGGYALGQRVNYLVSARKHPYLFHN